MQSPIQINDTKIVFHINSEKIPSTAVKLGPQWVQGVGQRNYAGAGEEVSTSQYH